MASAKGSSIVLVVKLLRAQRAEAVKRLPPELLHYLEDRILVSSWYPEEDLFELLQVGVKLIPTQGDDPWYVFGQFAAAAHVRETYQHLLAARDAEEILRQINVVWRSQHDTGTFRADLVEAGHAVLALEDHPILSGDWCLLLSGYMVGMLGAAGGRDIVVREIHCRTKGDPACVWRLTWTPAAARST